jgi:hypothetical protein
MQTHRLRLAAAAVAALIVAVFGCALPDAAWAARVGVLSNNFVGQTAIDFSTHVAGHTFTPIDVSDSVPTIVSLTTNFDVLLVFEDGTFVNSTVVGNLAASFASTGRTVVVGTFYDQDRTDGSPALTPHGWGALETLDPNTTDGVGTPYAPRSLDAASIVVHPLTSGVLALFSKQFAGGNEAKAGTVVVASWAQPNARGRTDPAIAYRLTGAACVIHIAIAPNYPSIGVFGTDFGGDFYLVWQNAVDFGADHCTSSAAAPPGAGVPPVPTLSAPMLALTVLLLAGLAAGAVRARRRGRR